MSNEVALSMLQQLGPRRCLHVRFDTLVPPDSNGIRRPDLFLSHIQTIAREFRVRFNIPIERQQEIARMVFTDIFRIYDELEEEYGPNVDFIELAMITLEDALDALVDDVPERYQILVPKAPQSNLLTYQAYKSSVLKTRITAAVRDDINDNCPICLESFKLGRTVHKTSCGHHFHPRCLQHFICKVGPNKCPVCRTCIEPISKNL